MRRTCGIRQRGEQTSTWPVRGGHLYEFDSGRMSGAMPQSGEIFLSQRRVRRANPTVRHIRGRLGLSERRYRHQQQPQSSFLRLGLLRQS